MIYALAYILISVLYGYIVFVKHPAKEHIPAISHVMFGTTFPLHLFMTIIALLYKPFGVNIGYMVTVNTEDKE